MPSNTKGADPDDQHDITGLTRYNRERNLAVQNGMTLEEFDALAEALDLEASDLSTGDLPVGKR